MFIYLRLLCRLGFYGLPHVYFILYLYLILYFYLILTPSSHTSFLPPLNLSCPISTDFTHKKYPNILLACQNHFRKPFFPFTHNMALDIRRLCNVLIASLILVLEAKEYSFPQPVLYHDTEPSVPLIPDLHREDTSDRELTPVVDRCKYFKWANQTGSQPLPSLGMDMSNREMYSTLPWSKHLHFFFT